MSEVKLGQIEFHKLTASGVLNVACVGINLTLVTLRIHIAVTHIYVLDCEYLLWSIIADLELL